MGRGFCSEDNLNALFKEHMTFLIAGKMSIAWIRRELEGIYENFRSSEVYDDTYQLCCRTIQAEWHYTQKRPYKGDTISESRRVYLHYYYNIDKAAEKEKAFDRELVELRKDLVEKAFGNLKERLNLRRTLVSSEQSLDGKLFIECVALIYLSYIKKRMQDTGLFKQYTLQGALDKLDIIECFTALGQGLRVGEILEKQKDIYVALGVAPPTSL